MSRAIRSIIPSVALLLVALTLTSACGGDGGRTTLTFFQFKPEAARTSRTSPASSRREPGHPRHRRQLPDPETALRTRLVKGRARRHDPQRQRHVRRVRHRQDLRDFAGDPVLDDVNPAFVEVIAQLGAGGEGEVNGVPFAGNASGVLYNEDLFAAARRRRTRRLGRADRCRGRSSRTRASRRSTGCSRTPGPRSPRLRRCRRSAPRTSSGALRRGRRRSQEGWREAAEQLGSCTSTPSRTPAPRGTRTAPRPSPRASRRCCCSAATPCRRSVRASPSSRSAAWRSPPPTTRKTTLVSGVDVVITAAGRRAPEEAEKFIDFLMRRKVVETYCKAQVAIPTLTGLTNDDPALAGVQSYIETSGSSASPTTSSSPPSRCATAADVPARRRRDTFLERLDAELGPGRPTTYLGNRSGEL